VHLEVRAVQVQVVELDVIQPPLTPGGELILDRLADLADGRLRQRCRWPERVRQCGLDIADR